MTKTSIILLFLIGLLWLPLSAEEETAKFGISFSGFVKSDFFYDSRQTVSIREGHFLLYPAAEDLDANGEDINADSSFNFISIQTRLTGAISAPDAFGAKVKGVVEADFFGNENAAFVDANGFRLRHAYAQLSWKKTQLLFGQYWHPMFVPACYSEVISFNTGSPMQPFSRNPQLRFTRQLGRFSLIAVMAAQRDFTSPGGSNVQRNAALPEFHLQLQYQNRPQPGGNGFMAGIGAGYKSIQPLLFSEAAAGKFASDEMVSDFSLTAFAKFSASAFTLKIQGVYGGNLFDLLMLGGYAVHEVTDASTNRVTYTALKTMSAWTEFMTQGKKVQFGLWGGYTQNLGAGDPIAFYSDRPGGTLATVRGANIKSVMRVSPRIVFPAGKFSLAFEAEYTRAAYADRDETGTLFRDGSGVITRTRAEDNLRLLAAAVLRF